jgi:hypothetical protein
MSWVGNGYGQGAMGGNGWVQLTHAQLWVGYGYSCQGYSCQAQCRTLVCSPFSSEPLEVGGRLLGEGLQFQLQDYTW